MMLCTSAQRPDLFERLVIYDPPAFSLHKRLAMACGLALPDAVVRMGYPLIPKALQRRDRWVDAAEAGAFFRERSRLFQSFDGKVVDAFLAEGLKPEEAPTSAVRLAFDKEAEAHIYRTVPTEIYRQLLTWTGTAADSATLRAAGVGQYDSRTPGTFLFSGRFELIGRRDVAWLERRLGNLAFRNVDESHFWPLEQPAAFAERVFAEAEAQGGEAEAAGAAPSR